jgi:hypothetical protein
MYTAASDRDHGQCAATEYALEFSAKSGNSSMAKADEIGGWLKMHGLDHADGLLGELMALVDDMSEIPEMRAAVATLLTNAATALGMLPKHQERLHTATASRDANLLSAVVVADEAGQILYEFGSS